MLSPRFFKLAEKQATPSTCSNCDEHASLQIGIMLYLALILADLAVRRHPWLSNHDSLKILPVKMIISGGKGLQL